MLIAVVVMEILMRCKERKEVDFVVPEASMGRAEFEKAISEGRKLVILDELVLDVEKFID